MKTDWIAVFKSDFTSKVFEEKAKSDAVLYWIKRYENGEFSKKTFVGLTKQLRSFEIFDTNFNPSKLSYGITNWKCFNIVETGHDNQGSFCYCFVEDKEGVKFKVPISGFYSKDNNSGWSPKINENLYFTSIMLFLRMISVYNNWKELEERNNDLYKDIISLNGIPQDIFKKTELREIELNKVWHSSDSDFL